MINPYIESRNPEDQIMRILSHLGTPVCATTILLDGDTAIGYKVHGPDAIKLAEYKIKYAEYNKNFTKKPRR